MQTLINLYNYYMDMAEQYKGTDEPERYYQFNMLARAVAREIERRM